MLINITCFIVSENISVFPRKPSHEQIYLGHYRLLILNDVYGFLLFQYMVLEQSPQNFVHKSIMNWSSETKEKHPKDGFSLFLSVASQEAQGLERKSPEDFSTCLKADAATGWDFS